MKELEFAFQIENCKNNANSAPLGIGICHRDTVRENGFEFIGDEGGLERSKSSKKSLDSRTKEENADNHGCYLLTSNGFIRNHFDAK